MSKKVCLDLGNVFFFLFQNFNILYLRVWIIVSANEMFTKMWFVHVKGITYDLDLLYKSGTKTLIPDFLLHMTHKTNSQNRTSVFHLINTTNQQCKSNTLSLIHFDPRLWALGKAIPICQFGYWCFKDYYLWIFLNHCKY